MNTLEHHILQVFSVKNVTDEYIKRVGSKPLEPLFEVDMEYDCYGVIERKTVRFFESCWKEASKTKVFRG